MNTYYLIPTFMRINVTEKNLCLIVFCVSSVHALMHCTLRPGGGGNASKSWFANRQRKLQKKKKQRPNSKDSVRADYSSLSL